MKCNIYLECKCKSDGFKIPTNNKYILKSDIYRHLSLFGLKTFEPPKSLKVFILVYQFKNDLFRPKKYKLIKSFKEGNYSIQTRSANIGSGNRRGKISRQLITS